MFYYVNLQIKLCISLVIFFKLKTNFLDSLTLSLSLSEHAKQFFYKFSTATSVSNEEIRRILSRVCAYLAVTPFLEQGSLLFQHFLETLFELQTSFVFEEFQSIPEGRLKDRGPHF